MPSETADRRRRVVQYLSVGVVCLFAAAQFYGAEPRPWGIATVWAACTVALAGPVAWLARDQIPQERRETLTYVSAGAGILIASVWLGVALAFAPRLFPFGPGFVVGVAFGTLVVLLAERTVVPERLRGAGL